MGSCLGKTSPITLSILSRPASSLSPKKANVKWIEAGSTQRTTPPLLFNWPITSSKGSRKERGMSKARKSLIAKLYTKEGGASTEPEVRREGRRFDNPEGPW